MFISLNRNKWWMLYIWYMIYVLQIIFNVLDIWILNHSKALHFDILFKYNSLCNINGNQKRKYAPNGRAD
jgi:hypothetical protein